MGKLTMATLSRLDISTKTVKGAVQYLVVAISPTTKATTFMTTIRASSSGTPAPTPTRWASRSCSAAKRSFTRDADRPISYRRRIEPAPIRRPPFMNGPLPSHHGRHHELDPACHV